MRAALLTAALLALTTTLHAAEKPTLIQQAPGIIVQSGSKVAIYAFSPVGSRPPDPWPYPYPPYPSTHPAFPAMPFYPSYGAPTPYVPLGSGYPPPPVEVRGMELKPGGRLVIEVEPQDADVYVDAMRLVNRTERGFDLGLLAGRHRVDVRRAGSQPWSQDVDVPAGGGLLITIELVDRKPPAQSEPTR